MATVFDKSPAVSEDILWDLEGTTAIVAVPTSKKGMARNGHRINASHIPSTTTTRAKARIVAGTPATTKKNVDDHIAELYDDVALIGKPDAVTIENAAGLLEIKSRGVNTAQLTDNSVNADKIAAGAVGTTEIATSAVTPAELAANAVETAKIDDLAVTSGKLALNAVTSDKITADSVTNAKIEMDTSAGLAHGLFVAYTGQMTISAAGPTNINIPGVASSDIAFAVNATNPPANDVRGARCITDNVAVKLTDGTESDIKVIVLRVPS